MSFKYKFTRDMLNGYMGARSDEGKKMYARYLSYVNPFLFEEVKEKKSAKK